jgi:iduronate 2-sulfatase
MSNTVFWFRCQLCILLGVVGYGGANAQGSQPNILLICVDDLRTELPSYGADYIVAPNMERLGRSGRLFQRHYVNAPSCGPSRYTLLTGRYGPADNMALFHRAAALRGGADTVPPSMPEWFRRSGYRTVSVGKVSHHPGGMGGPRWNDTTDIEMPAAWDAALMPSGEWADPRGSMHGLANGYIRPAEPNTMPALEAAEGGDAIYPDGRIIATALAQLEQLVEGEQPFFLAVGLIKPHLPFGAPRKYLDLYEGVDISEPANPKRPEGVTTWHESGEFRRYKLSADPLVDSLYADSLRRHYAACISYADANVGKLLDKLADTGADTNTVVILWGDHGWHLGDHAIWGKHTLFEESLHSPLIVRYPGMPAPGRSTAAIVETSGIFPTLCELAKLPRPSYVHGTSFLDLLRRPGRDGRPAVGYWGDFRTVRTDRYRLISHPGGEYELYDHRDDPHELRNLALERPDVVARLSKMLSKRLAPRVTTY